MRTVFFVNPTRITTGTAFVMPAAQVTLAGAVPQRFNIRPLVIDEAITRFDPSSVDAGDVVCVSALTNNCLQAYRVAREARARGATVVLGGPHPTLLPEEALANGADYVVRGDGDTIIGQVLEDVLTGKQGPLTRIYQDPSGHPFRVAGEEMAYPRLDLVDLSKYCTASIRSTAGCREHCTFCTVPTISGSVPRERPVEMVAREVRELHDYGIRIVLWGADNLVPVPSAVVRDCRNPAEAKALEAEREKSLAFFRQFGKLTGNKRAWGFAQLTVRLYDDPEMLRVLRDDGGICAALFGIETIDPIALKRMAKQWNGSAAEMIVKIKTIQEAGIHALGSMIIGLPTDTLETIAAMRRFARESGMSVAQFPIYEILPGSPDYVRAARDLKRRTEPAAGLPIMSDSRGPAVQLLRDRYWLEEGNTPHLQHPSLDFETQREEGRKSWRYFYRLFHLLRNARRYRWSFRKTLTYAMVCKAFARFYGGAVGLSADSVRTGDASWFQRKLMAFGVRLIHKLPSPPPVPQ